MQRCSGDDFEAWIAAAISLKIPSGGTSNSTPMAAY
jgi:hypothetical protein